MNNLKLMPCPHSCHLQWTTEKPTEAGWYWRQQGHCKPVIVKVTDRNLGHGEKCLAVDGETREYFLTCNAQWAGPIPMPKEIENGVDTRQTKS